MIESGRAVENVVERLKQCGFKIREENQCFYEVIVEEIMKEIVENGEVFLKEKIQFDMNLHVLDGEISVGEESIISEDKTILKIK
jgi:hypothetical protein